MLLGIPGTMFLGIGALGGFLPVLLTTPFLLLAAACYALSWSRLHRGLITHPRFGPPVRNFREHKAIALRVKVYSLLLALGMIGYAAGG